MVELPSPHAEAEFIESRRLLILTYDSGTGLRLFINHAMTDATVAMKYSRPETKKHTAPPSQRPAAALCSMTDAKKNLGILSAINAPVVGGTMFHDRCICSEHTGRII